MKGENLLKNRDSFSDNFTANAYPYKVETTVKPGRYVE
jgi:hypothetical protein